MMPMLSTLFLMPMAGAIFLTFLPLHYSKYGNAIAKTIGLVISLATLVFTGYIAYEFNPNLAGLQLAERYAWIASYNIFYHVSIDGISLVFLLLTAGIVPICLISGFGSINQRMKEYVVYFLLLESLIIGVFIAQDALLFYIFFEAVLIPMFFIIGIWGGVQRIYAAIKFFLYTLAGSILFLISILVLYQYTGTTDIAQLALLTPKLDSSLQHALWCAMAIAFAVKIPMFPVHTWLPDAHVQAPTSGSVILAAVLLKLGGYGFLRFSLPLFPESSIYFSNAIFVLSSIAIIYGAMVAYVQTDMKKTIAYSSISHMGMVTIGIFTIGMEGIQGAIVQMISHGIVSGALFLCVGVLYDRMHTRDIVEYGGVVTPMPAFSMLFLIFTLASIGLPGTSGFVGEFLVILGGFMHKPAVGIAAATGMVLGALYMLTLYRAIIFGKPSEKILALPDLSAREFSILLPLAGLVLALGILPACITHFTEKPVKQMISHFAMTHQHVPTMQHLNHKSANDLDRGLEHEHGTIHTHHHSSHDKLPHDSLTLYQSK